MKPSFPRIIDGGLASYLETQGHDLNHKLWSARLLTENPEAIKEAHVAFLESGAQCIISASYQASFAGYKAQGISKTQAEHLLLKSVSLAVEARAEFLQKHPSKGPIWVAASIGPYGAYLADGSEYSGKYDCSREELIHFHADRLEILGNSSADYLACETIPSLQEAEVLHELLTPIDKPAWISFSCQDGKHLNDGTRMSQAAKLFVDHPSVFAVGVNCTAPQYVSSLIREIKSLNTDKKIIVYPNSGEAYDAEDKTWSGESPATECSDLAREWFKAGANMIGGCCRMGPEHISAMAHI